MNAQNSLIYIENGGLKAGILTDVGGRIVLLQYNGSANLLESDSAQWSELPSEKPKVSPKSKFKAYNGHIVWLGPQSEWWAHQDVNKKRKKEKAVWPPDPYLIYGNYSISEQTDSTVTLTGPESPVSGLQLTKTIRIDAGGKLFFEVTAKNIRTEAVSWDLWLNTRLNGLSRCFVPVSQSAQVRIPAVETKKQQVTPSSTVNGFFTFLPEAISKPEASAKAFIYPDKPYIAAVAHNQLLIIRFEHHAPNQIHSEQALVEIYNFVTQDRKNTLLELEYHSPYTTLQPGQSFSAWETWEVRSLTEPVNDTSITEYLKQLP